MEKVIVFTEAEYNNLLTEFVKNFQEYARKGYGCHLVTNEGEQRIDDFTTLCGSFLLPWNDTFNKKQQD